MKKLGLILLIGVIVTACSSEPKEPIKKDKSAIQKELVAKINQTEEKLFKAEDKSLNYNDAKLVVELYKEYANNFPLENQSPEYLFKAVDVSMGLQDFLGAKKILDRITRDYGNFDKIVEVYYLKAFIYDVHLNEKGNAQEAYQYVIDTYPESKWADDASAAIKVLTMSDKDLIKMFEEKNKKPNS